jgi:cytochrome b subunit of formate dehydrogenase
LDVQPFRFPFSEIQKSCAQCHQAQGHGLASGAHGQAGTENGKQRDLPLDCRSCHGEKAHGMVSVRDPQSPVFVGKRAQLCGDCHEKQKQKHRASAHGGSPPSSSERAPLVCTDCHGIHATRSVADADVTKMCAQCHESQGQGLAGGVHGQAGVKGQAGEKGPAGEMSQVGAKGDPRREVPHDCSACHGKNVHAIVSVQDPLSSVFVENQVRLCGECHQQQLQEYDQSVHGHGLRKSGLLVTAVCANCHGAHGILPASDENSSLHATNVAGTCAKCHWFIEERLRQSVHGGGNGLGGETEEPTPGGQIKRHPSCTDCHQGHDLPHPGSMAFRLRSADRCGNCHVDLFRSYAISMHGALTDLGHVPGAKCYDCHGGHDILPLDDPNCRLAPGENRLATCQLCHPEAVPKFCNYLPHTNYKEDPDRFPVLHGIHLGMELLIYSVFAFFGLHSILWFVRSTIHVARHGRPRRLAPGKAAYVRFMGIHRILHAIVAASFLGLALTGLPIRYSTQPWAQTLARFLGGFGSTSLWHHICGIITILYFIMHLGWLAKTAWVRSRQNMSWSRLCFGPDSPVPNLRDIADIFRMFRWFVGLGPKPIFERWTYWEKFDYWAVFWGVAIIGSSGMVLWFPNLFCRFLPGEALNAAKIIHSEEALLATSFIFAIHFFGTHVRPEKFPMDMSVLSGLVSAEEMREERPEFLQRMRAEGKLEQLHQTLPPGKSLWPIMLGGFLAVATGLALLAGMLLAIFGG